MMWTERFNSFPSMPYPLWWVLILSLGRYWRARTALNFSSAPGRWTAVIVSLTQLAGCLPSKSAGLIMLVTILRLSIPHHVARTSPWRDGHFEKEYALPFHGPLPLTALGPIRSPGWANVLLHKSLLNHDIQDDFVRRRYLFMHFYF